MQRKINGDRCFFNPFSPIEANVSLSLDMTSPPEWIQRLEHDMGVERLADLFGVSNVLLTRCNPMTMATNQFQVDDLTLHVDVSVAEGGQCGRCWKYCPSLDDSTESVASAVASSTQLCRRCSRVVAEEWNLSTEYGTDIHVPSELSTN